MMKRGAGWVVLGMCVAGLVAGGPRAVADISLDLHLTINGSYQERVYQAFLSPKNLAPATAGFVTGRIETADHRVYTTYGPSGWAATSVGFSDPADFLDSLRQPVVILLDEGLATERRYRTSIQLGGLEHVSLEAPSITTPTSGAVLPTLRPTLTFTLPAAFGDFTGWLGHWEDLGTFKRTVTDHTVLLREGWTSWQAPIALEPGVEYFFMMGKNYRVGDLSIGAPVDESGGPAAGWVGSTGAWISSEATAQFTVVPEAGTVGVAAAAVAGLLLRRRGGRAVGEAAGGCAKR